MLVVGGLTAVPGLLRYAGAESCRSVDVGLERTRSGSSGGGGGGTQPLSTELAPMELDELFESD